MRNLTIKNTELPIHVRTLDVEQRPRQLLEQVDRLTVEIATESEAVSLFAV